MVPKIKGYDCDTEILHCLAELVIIGNVFGVMF